MLSTRYSIVIANRRTGVVRRFTVSLRPLAVAVTVLCAIPLLAAVGASRKAAWQRATLAMQVSALEAENESIKAAAGALTNQITTLQTVVDDLSRLAPTREEQTAMARLPRRLRDQALGGLSPDAARLALAGPSIGPDAVGVVRQMLSALESSLQTARPRLEQQVAIARATPAIWPALGPLSSPFGSRRDPFTLAASLHPGIDLDVDHGAPVHATADGVVTEARYHPEYGNLVIVSHGFGIETRYAHLSRLLVRPGTSITRGHVVGHAGSTGRSTGTHLHYEVWIDGRPVNPLHYLVAQGGGRS